MKFKFLSLLIVLYLLGTHALYAQNLGVKLTGSLSKITIDYVDKATFTPTFSVGAYSDIILSENLFFRPELSYAMKGMNYKGDITRLHYIQLPASFFYKTSFNSINTMEVGIGPYIGIAVGGKTTNNQVDKEIKFKNKISATDDLSKYDYYKKYDVGGLLILGYEYKNRVGAGVEMAISFMNIAAENHPQRINYKNVNFGFFITYNILSTNQ